MNTRTPLIASALLAANLISGTAHAVPVINAIGLTNANHTITFDEIVLPMGTVVVDQFNQFGIYFSTITVPGQETSDMRYDVQGSMGGCSGGVSGDSCFTGLNGHTVGSSGASSVFIHFSGTQNYAAFGMASNPREFVFTALLSGQPVESFSAISTGGSTPYVNNKPAGYYGFTGINFDTIEIRSILSSPSNNRVILDNIQISAVPEPTAGAMMLAGLGLVGLMARRRKQSES